MLETLAKASQPPDGAGLNSWRKLAVCTPQLVNTEATLKNLTDRKYRNVDQIKTEHKPSWFPIPSPDGVYPDPAEYYMTIRRWMGV
jgi:hypothetical protein